MRTSASILVVANFILAAGGVQAGQTEDYSKWLGREPSDMPSAINLFIQGCVIEEQSYFAKKTKSIEEASNRTAAQCSCVAKFLEAKDDLEYVQTITADFNKRLEVDGRAPKELELYLDGYIQVSRTCEKDPTFEFHGQDNDTFDPALLLDPATLPESEQGKKHPFKPQVK